MGACVSTCAGVCTRVSGWEGHVSLKGIEEGESLCGRSIGRKTAETSAEKEVRIPLRLGYESSCAPLLY